MSVRVRYAPSPTGSPHVGNIRDALFKHLFAKHHKGVNILRIEDTDRTRFIPGVEEEIVESLNWMGIEFQEGFGVGGENGPYRQSERKELGIYEKWIKVLMERGHAYKAFETSEELDEMREFQKINKQNFGYFGGMWRDATPAQVEAAEAAGKPFVFRQRMPKNTTIVIEDAIRGRVEFDSNTVDDAVLIKGDGMPTYHFAAMVDDHLMGITHIMRGEEWISSAPKHAALFDSFGWERPIFVHCPVINGKDGKKLSKRHGDTKCLDFRAAGYLPHTLGNFIALIGWAPGGDRELMTMDELCEAFDLGGLQPAPGVFDMDKLNWMNGHYLRQLSPSEIVTKVREFAVAESTAEYWEREVNAEKAVMPGLLLLNSAASTDLALVERAVQLEQERVVTLAEFGEACAFFFQDEPPFDPKATEKWFAVPHARQLLEDLVAHFEGVDSCTPEDCESFIRSWAETNAMEKIGPVVHPTRVAMTGKTVGPGLFELMAALGPARIVKRAKRALAQM